MLSRPEAEGPLEENKLLFRFGDEGGGGGGGQGERERKRVDGKGEKGEGRGRGRLLARMQGEDIYIRTHITHIYLCRTRTDADGRTDGCCCGRQRRDDAGHGVPKGKKVGKERNVQ